MIKILKNLLLIFAVSAVLWPASVFADDPGDVGPQLPDQCRSFFNNGGYLFDDLEQATYSNGFLEMHFKLKEPYNDGRGWFAKVFMHKLDCTTTSYQASNALIGPLPSKMQLYSVRFSNETHYDLWDDEIDLKIDCDGCSGDIPTGDYSRISYSGLRDGGATFFHSADYAIKQVQPAPNPLLIVPGVTGTELLLNAKPVWLDLPQLLINSSDDFMNVLDFNGQGLAINTSVVPGQVIKSLNYSFGTYHYLDLLINDLNAAGYKLDESIFMFPYDWRLSAKDLALQLAQKVTEILTKTGAAKVDIIAHSYGGLITKQYLLSHGPEIGKTILVGVPNLGSANAAKTLLFGDNLGIPLLSSEEIRKLSQNMPSIYDLLPSKEYFLHNQGYYDDFANPNVKSILNYDQSKDFLISLGKNKTLLEQSEQLHVNSFDNFIPSDPNNTFNIVGCALPTLKTINKMFYGQGSILSKILKQPKYRITTDNGDGTVLLPSASHIQIPAKNTFYMPGVEHGKLLSSPGIIGQILALLKGTTSTLGNGTSGCGVKGKLVSLPSNLEFNISNKSTGTKLVSGLDYSEDRIGDSNYIYLPPSNDDYVLASAANSPIDVSIKNYDNSKTTYYDQVTVNQKFQVTTGPAGDAVEVDDNDQPRTVTPTYTEEQSGQAVSDTVDSVAPVTKLIFGSKEYSAGLLNLNPENHNVTFIALDDISGVLVIRYSLDDGDTWKDYSSAFDVPIGVSTVWFYSMDKVENIEEPKRVDLDWGFSGDSTTVIVNPPVPVTVPVGAGEDNVEALDAELDDADLEPSVDAIVEDEGLEPLIVSDSPVYPEIHITINLPEAKQGPAVSPSSPSGFGWVFKLFNSVLHLIFF